MTNTVDPSSADPDSASGKNPAWKKWLPIVLLALVGAGAAGGWFYWQRSAAKTPQVETEKEAAPKPPVFQVLDPFTVNLQDDGQFLQVAFTLQLTSQEDVDRLKLYMPQARSRLLMLLTAKTGEEIASTEGKQQLIKDVMATVRQPFAAGLPEIDVSNVFITSFVIQ